MNTREEITKAGKTLAQLDPNSQALINAREWWRAGQLNRYSNENFDILNGLLGSIQQFRTRHFAAIIAENGRFLVRVSKRHQLGFLSAIKPDESFKSWESAWEYAENHSSNIDNMVVGIGHKAASIELYNETHTDNNPWLGFVVFKLSEDAAVSIVDAFDRFSIPIDSESMRAIEETIRIHLTRKGFHA